MTHMAIKNRNKLKYEFICAFISRGQGQLLVQPSILSYPESYFNLLYMLPHIFSIIRNVYLFFGLSLPDLLLLLLSRYHSSCFDVSKNVSLSHFSGKVRYSRTVSREKHSFFVRIIWKFLFLNRLFFRYGVHHN